MIPVYTVDQLIDKQFPELHYADTGDCVVVLDDKAQVTMPIRLAIINGMIWACWRAFGIKIKKVNPTTKKSMIFWIKIVPNNIATTIGSEVYRDLVLFRNIDHKKALSCIYWFMCRLFSFVHRHCREYQASLDMVSLCAMCEQPELKEICDREIDEDKGSKVAEMEYAQISKDLIKILNSPSALSINPLKPFLDAKVLNNNQLPQMFCAYGPRADVTDKMMKHVINRSAMSGLLGIEDFAIEYLSAKKAATSNTDAITKAQYLARKCRLGASRLPKVYPGWCGSEVTIPYVINPKFKHNFLGKYIKVTKEEFKKYDDDKAHPFDDCSIKLTRNNIDHFVGRTVQMWSPFGCRHTDGVCEHCGGYMNQRMTCFMPDNMQLGVYAATQFVEKSTQKVLSAKHLIKTSSIEYQLGQHAAKYLIKDSDVLFWQSSMKTLRKAYLRINVRDVGAVSDLLHENLPSGASWSKIGMFEIVGSKGNTIDTVELTDGTIYPYFSGYFMEYMQSIFKELVMHNDSIDIPLEKFDFSNPVFKYTTTNSDMMGYVDDIGAFLSSGIGNYRSIPKVLEDFSTLVFSKTDINIFYIEVILRAFLVSQGDTDHSIPIITDPNQDVEFDKMGSMISESALSTKLAYERLQELFTKARPTLKAKGSGYGFPDPHFGFGMDVEGEGAEEKLVKLLESML